MPERSWQMFFGLLNTALKPLLRSVTLPPAMHGFWTLVTAPLVVWLANLVLGFVPGPWRITGKRRRLNLD